MGCNYIPEERRINATLASESALLWHLEMAGMVTMVIIRGAVTNGKKNRQ